MALDWLDPRYKELYETSERGRDVRFKELTETLTSAMEKAGWSGSATRDLVGKAAAAWEISAKDPLIGFGETALRQEFTTSERESAEMSALNRLREQIEASASQQEKSFAFRKELADIDYLRDKSLAKDIIKNRNQQLIQQLGLGLITTPLTGPAGLGESIVGQLFGKLF